MRAGHGRIDWFRTTRDHRCREGFSLFELMIVLGLVAALTGIVVGSLSSLRSTSLSVSAREFADFVNLCRSEAIARHTAIRIGIVEDSSRDSSENFRKYTAFQWNRQTRKFEQYRAWESLPGDLVFEEQFPDYVRRSSYFESDPAATRGDYVMELPGNDFVKEDANLEARYRFRFLQFSPAGRASAPSGTHRNLVLVMRPGESGVAEDVPNWAQFTIDTLTGRLRIQRP